MADEPNEIELLVELVAQRIRELLNEEGGLQIFLESGRQMKAQLEFADPVGITDSVETVITPGSAELNLQGAAPVVRVLQGASPGLVNDIRGRSPRDIKLAIDLWNAFWVTVAALVPLWAILHPQQPMTQERIMQIFNQATTIVHQTINMPPPPTP